jgi:hypothetical protein
MNVIDTTDSSLGKWNESSKGNFIFIPHQFYWDEEASTDEESVESDEISGLEKSNVVKSSPKHKISSKSKNGKKKKSLKKRKKNKQSNKIQAPEPVPSTTNITIDLAGIKRSNEVPSLKFTTIQSARECYNSGIVNALKRVKVFTEMRDIEMKEQDKSFSLKIWTLISNTFCNLFIKNLMGMTPIQYYTQLLDKFVREYVLETVTDLRKSGILEVFSPKKYPMCLSCIQIGVDDIFPRHQFLIPVKPMITAGLLPEKIMEYNPFGTSLICYSLFWSLNSQFAILGIIHDNSANGLNYEFITFDRKNNEINDLYDNWINTSKQNKNNI